MELSNTIKERYSLRNFADKAIEEETLKVILDAGRLAPTARNQQRTKTVIFPMGYAETDDGARRQKKPLEEFVCWDRF